METAPNASVLLVLTHSDDGYKISDSDLAAIKQVCPNLADEVLYIDSKSGAGVPQLKKKLVKMEAIKTNTIPKSFNKLKEILDSFKLQKRF